MKNRQKCEHEIFEPPKRHISGENTSNKHKTVTIHPPARLVGEPKKTKKERKEGRHPNRGRLAIRPDHRRRQVKMKLCMVGGLRCVYLSSVIQIGWRVTALWWVENGPFLLLWPVAYTTACNTVQAVIKAAAKARRIIRMVHRYFRRLNKEDFSDIYYKTYII